MFCRTLVKLLSKAKFNGPLYTHLQFGVGPNPLKVLSLNQSVMLSTECPLLFQNKLVDHGQFSMQSVYNNFANDITQPNWLESFIFK